MLTFLFSDPLSLEWYIDKDGKHVCLRCYKKYSHQRDVKKHLRFECGVKPQFICNFCAKAFKRKAHLKEHIFRKHKTLAAEFNI